MQTPRRWQAGAEEVVRTQCHESQSVQGSPLSIEIDVLASGSLRENFEGLKLCVRPFVAFQWCFASRRDVYFIACRRRVPSPRSGRRGGPARPACCDARAWAGRPESSGPGLGSAPLPAPPALSTAGEARQPARHGMKRYNFSCNKSNDFCKCLVGLQRSQRISNTPAVSVLIRSTVKKWASP